MCLEVGWIVHIHGLRTANPHVKFCRLMSNSAGAVTECISSETLPAFSASVPLGVTTDNGPSAVFLPPLTCPHDGLLNELIYQ